MSAIEERSRSKSPSIAAPAMPQVNLLPPEIRAARGLRVVKRWLVLTLVLVLVLCAMGFAGSLFARSAAANDLTQARAETSRLQLEQQKYAEVPQVLNALQAATSARALGMSTEVQWKAYLAATAAVLPQGVSIDSLVVTGATTMTPAAPAASPLQGPSVGEIQFTARSQTVPDTAALIDALNSVPGFADAFVTSTTVASNTALTYYTVDATVHFTSLAYDHRFAATEGTK